MLGRIVWHSLSKLKTKTKRAAVVLGFVEDGLSSSGVNFLRFFYLEKPYFRIKYFLSLCFKSKSMKQLFLSLSLFLLKNTLVFSQDKTHSILKIDVNVGQPFLYNHRYDSFYIDTIIDKRVNKSSNLGLVTRDGLLLTRLSWAKFENDNIADELNKICNMFLVKQENKTPIIAELKNINVSEARPTAYTGIKYVELEIDFYKKDENNNLKMVGHYHGKYAEQGDRNNPLYTREQQMCQALRQSLNTIDITGNKYFMLSKAKIVDTSYIPKKGFYYSFLDYLYNTPFGINDKVSIETGFNIYNEKYWRIRCKNDSLAQGFMGILFGYCDGKEFYTYSNRAVLMFHSHIFQKAYKSGRFLLTKSVPITFTNSTKKAKEIGLYISRATISNITIGDVIIDMQTGESCVKRRLRQPFDTTSRAYAQVVQSAAYASPSYNLGFTKFEKL